MARTWKYWMAAASVLLMVGAGCAAEVKQGANGPKDAAKTGEPAVSPQADGSSTGTSMENGGAKGDDIDSAVDAAIKEADDQTSAAMDENSDADVLNNDGTELNAYGQAYDSSKL